MLGMDSFEIIILLFLCFMNATDWQNAQCKRASLELNAETDFFYEVLFIFCVLIIYKASWEKLGRYSFW